MARRRKRRRNPDRTAAQIRADIDAIATVIEEEDVAGFATQGEPVHRVADAWDDYGFSSEDVRQWLTSGTFDPETAYELKEAGVTPHEASAGAGQDPEVGRGGLSTVGYKASAGEIEVGTAIALVKCRRDERNPMTSKRVNPTALRRRAREVAARLNKREVDALFASAGGAERRRNIREKIWGRLRELELVSDTQIAKGQSGITILGLEVRDVLRTEYTREGTPRSNPSGLDPKKLSRLLNPW